MIVMSSRKKLTKIKDVFGSGLSGLPVDVLFLPIVSMKVSSKLTSPTVITVTLIRAVPRSLNAGCGKTENTRSSVTLVLL